MQRIIVKCGFHIHVIAKNLNGNSVLGHFKDHERKFVNDMTKYNMASKYKVTIFKDIDPKNLTSVTHVYKAMSTHNANKRDL